MSKYLLALYHFLGSVSFAIILIAITILLVVIGTLLESMAASHLYAASWTYQHPFFSFLLSLYFINILFSALRRWPYKKRHIPFLLTHLGLLMLLTGQMIKNQFGLQGRLRLEKGIESNEVAIPNTLALLVENEEHKEMIPIDQLPRGQLPMEIKPFSLFCKKAAFAKHVEKNFYSFETPFTYRLIPKEAPLRLEECVPGIILEFQEGFDKQKIALAYDPDNLKWPLFNGKYKVRLQNMIHFLSFKLLLKNARQIFYPNSTQTYSYECELLVEDKEKQWNEHTLSMNRVYETWNGYRFYLSSIETSPDKTIQFVHLAVNYDPAKYLLSYPGAFLIFLGSFLLFWGRKS